MLGLRGSRKRLQKPTKSPPKNHLHKKNPPIGGLFDVFEAIELVKRSCDDA